jgi:hypothetical protein
MTTNTTDIKSTLTDDQIVQIAEKIDKLFLEIGKEYQPTGIELSAIALGRVMVFSHHTKCFSTFSDMMKEVCKMSEPEFLKRSDENSITKTEDIH